jgi:Domain of unknown function (DUF4926)
MEHLPLLSLVALLEALPKHNLVRGQVGTSVEQLAPEIYEVEFSDNNGSLYASTGVPAAQLLVLHYDIVKTSGN